MDPKVLDTFESLMIALSTPPILTRPSAKEILYLYLAVYDGAISSSLLIEVSFRF